MVGSIRFQTAPTTLQDNPTDLDLSHEESLEFYAFSQWLENSLALVREMETAADSQVLEHKHALEQSILEEIKRLETLKISRWDQEKALAGLYDGGGSSIVDAAPLEVDTSE